MNEALRLAEWFEGGLGGCELEAAAELRRLHADNKRICSALNGWIRENSPGGWIDALRTQRDALLAVLKDIAGTDPVDAALDPQRAVRIARAAIAAAEGENT